MKPERWQQIEQLYHSALERREDERSAFLDQTCAGDEALRREVESLLAYEGQAESFIETPAFGTGAALLAADQAESMVGKRIGSYKILGQIGAGGMGEVYRAQDTRLDREVALKLLPPDFTLDEDRVRRFQQEARAASALNHPNILVIYEIGTEDDTHFIATEFIDGETLRQRMVGSRMSLREVLDIAVQVASALAAAHAAGILHRDIKPENIMLRRDGYAKVLDFGLAKLTEKQASKLDAEAPVRTDPGTVMGTVAYMSPEQARGLSVDARTDIWSLGVVLYEMVAGRVPFEAETTSDVIGLILHKETTPLARYAPDVPAEMERIVMKALHKDREERYQVVKDLALDLKSLKQHLEFEAELERFLQPNLRDTTAVGKSSAILAVDSIKRPALRTDGSVEALAPSSVEYLFSRVKRHKNGVLLAVATLSIAIASLVYFSGGGKAIDSLAVLPFVNVNADTNTEYISDGISESIIYSLSQLPNLKVMSFSSVIPYKGRETNPQAVGHKLDVKAVLMGRVIQQGDKFSISAELVDARDNSLLWGHQYHRKLADIFVVQEEIAKDISEKLRLRLSSEEHKRLTRRYTDNTEAYQLYLMGRYYWNKRDPQAIRKGIEYFRQAIEKDPDYALAYAGLADSYSVPSSGLPAKERMQRAEEAATKALSIDDALAEAHASLGFIKYRFHWDWSGAEEEFKRAIELNRNYPTAHQLYGQYLGFVGRFDEAIRELRRAQELDPIAPSIRVDMGVVLYNTRQYEPAIEQYRRALETDQNFALAHVYLGRAYEQQGMYKQAVEEYLTWRILRRDSPGTVAALREAYTVSGWKGYLQKALHLAKEQSKKGPGQALSIAELYARLGEKEEAFEWFEKAYRDREDRMIALKADPRFDSLRSDPRFTDLLRRLRLTP